MHQIIAEQVLAYFQGGGDDWTSGLQTARWTDFIRDVVQAAGPDAVSALFRQMFVDRPGGGEDVEDRQDFSALIETLDAIGNEFRAFPYFRTLTNTARTSLIFGHSLGRYQVYKLRRDYDLAEEYLQRAVAISPDDPIHHHSYGLVLRSRLRESLYEAGRSYSVATVFQAIEPFFSRASAEFEGSTRDYTHNIHGYITHVQMIIDVARRLKMAANVSTVAMLEAEKGGVREWLQEHLSTAEELLREASHLYGTLEQSNTYLVSCNASLDELYGDLDRVVQLWEIANERGPSSPAGRRALANAYLARRKRRWNELDEVEIWRIADLMEDNLRAVGRRDEDYKLWFLAYRLLPEFDVDEALSRLTLWAKRFPSWRAFYYSYVLNFILWFSGRTDSLADFEEALEQCQRRHVGRKTASSLWYGKAPNNSLLVSEDDLGSWDREVDFWQFADLLLPANGMIEEAIPGPQAGYIRIDGRARVFFVPGRNFSANRDENERVNFMLGFSPAGLRGWSVKRGHVPNADRRRPSDRAAEPAPIHIQAPVINEEVKRERARALQVENLMRFADELINARNNLGSPLTISELQDRLDAAFGIKGALQAIGIENIEKTLSDTTAYSLARDGFEILITPIEGNERTASMRVSDASASVEAFGQVHMYNRSRNFGFIRVHAEDARDRWFSRDAVLPRDRAKLEGAHPLVAFHEEQGERGPVAIGVRILDAPLRRTRRCALPRSRICSGRT